MAHSSNVVTDKEYAAKCDMQTLIEAEKIEKDKKRFNAAKDCAKKMLADMQAIVNDKETEND